MNRTGASRDRWTFRRVAATTVAIFLAGVTLELLAILALNGGAFGYSLDDAYIHLALAENLARGHYGLNLGEPSAPSSSILWPILLAPFARLPFAAWVPLVLNVLAAAAALIVLARALDDHRPGRDERSPAAFAVTVSALAILCFNLLGLVFTGMEHTLQVLVSLLVVTALWRVTGGERVPPWLPLVLALGPLVRYEFVTLSLAGVAALALTRHVARALATGLATLLALLAPSLYFHALGLGWLPSSVITKSPTASHPGSPGVIYLNLQENLFKREGALLGVAVAVLLAIAIDPRGSRDRRVFAGTLAGAGVLHLVFGSFGWFSRYEIYAWAAMVTALVLLARTTLARAFAARPLPRAVAIATLIACAIGFRYLLTTLSTPIAANNIHSQQYQLHRFVTRFYREPVAVNDLGWVSFRNDRYVLDLWGLGSESALDQRTRATSADWMDDQLRHKGVRLAMIYDAWFPERPAGWRRLGELRFHRLRVTPAHATVAFYAVDDTAAARLRAPLESFQRSLPPGTEFAFGDAPAAKRPGISGWR